MTVSAGATAAYVGLKIYFRQREYELIKQRYLENGVDKVLSEFEACSSIVTQNWAACAGALAGAAGDQIPLKEILSNFKALPHVSPYNSAHARVAKITGSYSFLHIHQKATAFYFVQNNAILEKTKKCIEKISSTESKDPQLITKEIDNALSFIFSIKDRLQKFSSLALYLQEVSEFIETNKLGFKSIQDAPKSKQVRSIVQRLEADFANELGTQDPTQRLNT